MTESTSDLNISKPVSLWNQPLKIEPKKFFLKLGKAVLSGAKFEFEDSIENLSEAILESGLQDQAGQVAWVLIYRALLRSVTQLVTDSEDLLALAEPPDEAKQEELSGILRDNLEHCAVSIAAEFFEQPHKLPFLQAFKPGLTHWLRGLGLDELQARALAERLPGRFTLALHTEWLKEPERYEIVRKAVDTPFTKAAGQRRQWLQYHAWLREQVNGRMFAEAFSLQQVYVKLRAYYEEKIEDGEELVAPGPRENPRQNKKHRIAVDLHSELENWVRRYDKRDTVRVVSGGPGSGKSSFGKMFAAEMAEKQAIPVLFVPLHLFDPVADLVHAVERFVANNRYLTGSPLDASHGEDRLLVIFDGLDELAMQGRAAAEVAQDFVDEVLRRSDAFSGQEGLKRQFLISGRDLAVQANVGKLRQPRQVLHMLPYYTDEEERKKYTDPDKLLETDQRHDWWHNYGRVSGKNFRNMPEELQQKNLIEITCQPLLNYLVAISHSRKKLDFKRQTTLNEVYADLLQAVYERQWEGGRRHSGQGELKEENFFRILEEIALAIWHGDGRTATVNYIHTRCERGSLVRYLKTFEEGAQKGVTRLLTAFYFRQAGEVKGEKTFEFTHKSFGEYLTARRLVRMMKIVQDEMDRHDDNPDTGWDERTALQHWAEICGPATIDNYLYDFIENEVACYKKEDWHQWQQTVCRLIESAVTHGMPMEKLGLNSFSLMLKQSRNAEETLLVMHYACARLTEKVLKIKWPSPTAFSTWLRRLQEIDKFLIRRCLGHLDLQGCLLYVQDLFQAKLTGANLTNANLFYANLYQADLSDANLEAANLEAANLEAANFSRANLSRANLSEADLERADLKRANLKNAYNLDQAHGLKTADLTYAILPDGFEPPKPEENR